MHRLCIAKILNVEKLPVIVKTRHKEWVKLKEELYLFAQTCHLGSMHEGRLYQKLAHPDLQEIPAAHDNDDRFVAIKNNLSQQVGTLLDIGANTGYFSTRFAVLGYDCTAVELDDRLFYFLQRVSRIGGVTFRTVNKNILNMFDKPVEYDVVLALNILHHFLKTDERWVNPG